MSSPGVDRRDAYSLHLHDDLVSLAIVPRMRN